VIHHDRRGTTVSLPIGAVRAGLLAAKQAKVEQVEKRRRVRTWLIIGLVLAALAGGTWWYLASGPGAYTTVPTGLANQTDVSAIAVLDGAGLGHVVEKVNSRDVAAGLVLKSAPNEGSRIVKKGVVTLTVSLGPKMAQVPAVIGFALDKATAAITSAGLPLGTTLRQFDDITPKDQVLKVSKDAGTSVPDYTEIVLTVSDGPAPVAVPQEVGATKDVAVSDLKNAGLKSSVTEEFDGTVPAGTVVSQKPEQNTQAHRGDTIALVVSKGPEMIQVPNVVLRPLKDLTEATNTLQAAGFQVSTIPGTIRIPGSKRYVFAQSPAPPALAPRGSTVTLTVI
jgi:beta-lactam-binding protein with PASTA domain